jgi:hypothetical protein
MRGKVNIIAFLNLKVLILVVLVKLKKMKKKKGKVQMKIEQVLPITLNGQKNLKINFLIN